MRAAAAPLVVDATNMGTLCVVGGVSAVEELSPLLGLEVEVEVLQRPESADGQGKSRRQFRRGPTIDEERGAVIHDTDRVLVGIVLGRLLPHPDLADLAAPTTPTHVVG